MDYIVKNNEPLALVNSLNSYFKQRPPDCSLFSQYNCEIQIHRELLYQTSYLRDMIKSVNMDYSCCKIGVIDWVQLIGFNWLIFKVKFKVLQRNENKQWRKHQQKYDCFKTRDIFRINFLVSVVFNQRKTWWFQQFRFKQHAICINLWLLLKFILSKKATNFDSMFVSLSKRQIQKSGRLSQILWSF